MPAFGQHSLEQRATLDPRLQKLCDEVVKHVDCQIIEGKRSLAEHEKNKQRGVTKTDHSKHVYPLDGPSLAVDLAPYPIDWKDTKRFYWFGGLVKGIALQLGIKIRWGGDWDSDNDLNDQTFFDLVHFELV